MTAGKNVVPAYTGVYYNNELIGYVMEELDTAYFDDLRLNMDTPCRWNFLSSRRQWGDHHGR